MLSARKLLEYAFSPALTKRQWAALDSLLYAGILTPFRKDSLHDCLLRLDSAEDAIAQFTKDWGAVCDEKDLQVTARLKAWEAEKKALVDTAQLTSLVEDFLAYAADGVPPGAGLVKRAEELLERVRPCGKEDLP